MPLVLSQPVCRLAIAAQEMNVLEQKPSNCFLTQKAGTKRGHSGVGQDGLGVKKDVKSWPVWLV